MPTGTPTPLGRQTQFQQIHYLRITINYNDGNVANGVPKQWLPVGAILIGTDVYVDTVFNAATTNVVTVGTNGPSTYNNICTPTVTATGLTQNIPPTGTALGRLTAPAQVFAKYTQTGTPATAGRCYVIVKYAADNDGAN